MASISEVGHAKNASNFTAAYQILVEMQNLYNPTNTHIQLTNLLPIRTQLTDTTTVLNTKIPIFKNKVAERENLMAPVGKLITKIINYTKSLNIPDNDKQNVVTLGNKIRGNRKPKNTNPNSSTQDISTAQLSYDNRIANLGTLISQLNSQPAYQPNETDIQITTLQTLHANLLTLTSQVNEASNALITARQNRNKLLYTNPNNVIQLIKDIKSYLKSLGEPAIPYYKALVRLRFRPNE